MTTRDYSAVLSKISLFKDISLAEITCFRKKIKKNHIAKEDFKRLLLTNEELMSRYLSLCNEKIAFLLHGTEILAMQSCKTKVVIFLLTNEYQGKVRLEDTKETLAKSLGMSRAALFRELSDLKKKELISVKGSLISISDLEALENSIY